MKQDEGNSFTGALVVLMLLSVFLAFISSASGQRDFRSIMQSIKLAMTVPPEPYLSCSIDATGRVVENPAGESGL